jgi:general stress protein CsbA
MFVGVKLELLVVRAGLKGYRDHSYWIVGVKVV